MECMPIFLLLYCLCLINLSLRFLLAQLHMDFLMSQPTLGHIKLALQNLPQGMKGLDETYQQAMIRNEGQEQGY
jgi:hypothetical protein